MPPQFDEARDLMDTLIFTLGVISNSSSADREQIADAYSEARNFSASIAWEGRSARPRIIACLERFRTLQEANDIKAAGWMLTAIQERIAQKDLPEWEAFKIVAEHAVRSLLESRPRPH